VHRHARRPAQKHADKTNRDEPNQHCCLSSVATAWDTTCLGATNVQPI